MIPEQTCAAGKPRDTPMSEERYHVNAESAISLLKETDIAAVILCREEGRDLLRSLSSLNLHDMNNLEQSLSGDLASSNSKVHESIKGLKD